VKLEGIGTVHKVCRRRRGKLTLSRFVLTFSLPPAPASALRQPTNPLSPPVPSCCRGTTSFTNVNVITQLLQIFSLFAGPLFSLGWLGAPSSLSTTSLSLCLSLPASSLSPPRTNTDNVALFFLCSRRRFDDSKDANNLPPPPAITPRRSRDIVWRSERAGDNVDAGGQVRRFSIILLSCRRQRTNADTPLLLPHSGAVVTTSIKPSTPLPLHSTNTRTRTLTLSAFSFLLFHPTARPQTATYTDAGGATLTWSPSSHEPEAALKQRRSNENRGLFVVFPIFLSPLS
jgi:hypothetical protein